MMTEFLAAIGLIILYAIWLSSPIIMVILYENYSDAIGKLAGIVYAGGAFVIFYVLIKFIGIW